MDKKIVIFGAGKGLSQSVARQYWTLYEQQPSERETEICY